jgi:hypothetical protein
MGYEDLDQAADVEVFVPVPGALTTIHPGSGIVGSGEGDRLRCDYEGGRHGSAGLQHYADRVHHAWGRHSVGYPTVARAWLEPQTLISVGFYSPARGEILLHDQQASEQLAGWLGVAKVTPDLLLTAGVMRHQMRRETLAAAHSGDPRQMMAAREMSRRYSLGVRVPGLPG